MLALTERVLNDWGLRGIERATQALAKLAPDGGLLALTATLLTDSRVIHGKLHLLDAAAQAQDREDVATVLEGITPEMGTRYEFRERLPKVVMSLETVPLDDIAQGAVLTRLLEPVPIWARTVARPDDEKMEHAIAYAQTRLPGLADILKAHHNSGV